MKGILIAACLGVCAVAVAESPVSVSDFKLPKLLSPGEAAAREAKDKKENEEAMARLPRFDPARLQQILKVLREITYPIPFDALCEKLGGPDSLVWCCTRNYSRVGEKTQKQTSSFLVAGDATEYELVVDYEDFPVGRPAKFVARARLCYTSPLGWRFSAESEEDWRGTGFSVKKSN